MIDDLHRSDLLHRIPAAENILRDTSLRNRLKLLMHHGDSLVQRIIRIDDVHFLTLINDLARIHLVNTKQALHQCGFSRTIFSHECMNGAWSYFQRNIVQCFYAREAFTYPAQFQHVLLCHPCNLPYSLSSKPGVRTAHPVSLLICVPKDGPFR